jgi:hypothetical protein
VASLSVHGNGRSIKDAAFLTQKFSSRTNRLLNMKTVVFWDVTQILTDISEELTASIIRTVSYSETSVNIYQITRCNIPEDSRLHTHRRENLKSLLLNSSNQHKVKQYIQCH